MIAATVAAIGLRELLRRRIALLFVVVLPLVFYLVRIDVPWQALRFLALGVGWAIATLALFSHVGARRLDRRLAVEGASPTALHFGRQLAVVAVGVAVAIAYFLVVIVTQETPRPLAVGLLLLTTVLVAAPLGAVVGLIVPRELEGALALLAVMAVQLLVDPADLIAKALPFWSTRELSAYAIEPVGVESLQHGLVHFAIVLLVLVAVGWIAAVMRLSPARIPAPREDDDGLRRA
jgi:hypothetical protein